MQIASRIVAQVDHQVRETLLLQTCQGYQQFGIGLFTKVLHLDVARVVVEHICCGDRLGGNLTTGNLIRNDLGVAIARHTNLHLRSLRTFQSVHGLLIGHHLAHKLLAIHIHNLVAGQQTRLLCRSVLDDVLHVDGVLTDGKLNTYARERSLEVVVGGLHILGADVDRVGIELSEDLRDGTLHERVNVDLVDILVIDDAQQVVRY